MHPQGVSPRAAPSVLGCGGQRQPPRTDVASLPSLLPGAPLGPPSSPHGHSGLSEPTPCPARMPPLRAHPYHRQTYYVTSQGWNQGRDKGTGVKPAAPTGTGQWAKGQAQPHAGSLSAWQFWSLTPSPPSCRQGEARAGVGLRKEQLPAVGQTVKGETETGFCDSFTPKFLLAFLLATSG